MDMIAWISSAILPMVVALFLWNGMFHKIALYECFVEGAKKGIKTVLQIMPSLIGLMVGVGVLRASGFLEWMTTELACSLENNLLPKELIPCIFVRMFSSSAAIGLILDLFETYGPDSRIGLIASISNACTETVFYTMSIYFLQVHVKKTRWTLAGALISSFAGILMSLLLVQWLIAS